MNDKDTFEAADKLFQQIEFAVLRKVALGDSRLIGEAREALRAALAASTPPVAVEPVATVLDWTNGSYSRNYRLEWHRDVPAGSKLYTSPQADALDAMTDEQRLEVFSRYCTHCGRKDPGCQCWNDE